MRWSKVKKLVEESFAQSVQRRVQLHTTHYGGCNCGHAWVTIDGIMHADFSTRLSGDIYRAVYHETTNTDCATHPAVPVGERTPGKLVEDGEFSRFDLHEACWSYLHQSLKDSLESDNPLVKSLAILNAKVGKGRLAKLKADEQMHPLPKSFLKFRMEAELELVN